jgi:integrase
VNRFTSQPIKPADAGDQPAALQVPPTSIIVDTALAQPLRQTRKSMSRRSGQDSSPYKAGKWWRVRARFDVPGQQKRLQRSLRVCLVSERHPVPVIKRMAKDVIAASGANSEERFNRVVLGEGITFRQQANVYLEEATTRNREPIQDPTTIKGALRKWILPEIGDMTLSQVDNVTVKPLVTKMVREKLSPETIRKYMQFVQQVVASKRFPNGEEMYPRKWKPEVMDLPVIVSSEQRRPAQKADGVNALVGAATSDEEKYLYVLLAATGMRISEALALEAKHFINGGRTIKIEQQVMKDCPKIKKKLKTDASKREVDLHPDVAAYLGKFVAGKSGLLLHTSEGTPYLYGNLADDWLDPRLAKLGLYEAGMGWHSFKRFRNSWLRAPAQHCQEDLRKFWLAHKPKEMGELYSALKEDLLTRLAEAERVGYGFTLPTQKLEVVPSVPRKLLFVVSRKQPQQDTMSIG